MIVKERQSDNFQIENRTFFLFTYSSKGAEEVTELASRLSKSYNYLNIRFMDM